MLFLLRRREAEFSNALTERVILAVRIGQKICALHVDFSAFVKKRFMAGNAQNVRHKNVVRAHGDHLGHAAFQGHGAARNRRRLNGFAFHRFKAAFFEFVQLRLNATSPAVGAIRFAFTITQSPACTDDIAK